MAPIESHSNGALKREWQLLYKNAGLAKRNVSAWITLAENAIASRQVQLIGTLEDHTERQEMDDAVRGLIVLKNELFHVAQSKWSGH